MPRSFIIPLLTAVLPWFFINASEISNIRTAKDGQKQRIVIDIDGQKEPAFYIKKAKNEINITIETVLSYQRSNEFKKVLEGTRYIERANFTLLEKEGETILTIFTNPKEKVSDEIFALPSPSRLVIDLDKAQY